MLQVAGLRMFAIHRRKQALVLVGCCLFLGTLIYLPKYEPSSSKANNECEIKYDIPLVNVQTENGIGIDTQTTTGKPTAKPTGSPTPKPTPKPMIDVDFKLILPSIEPKMDPQERSLYLVVVVNSAAKGENHRTLRQTIRKTWGNGTRPRSDTFEWKLFFVLGVADNQTEHEANLQEARENNDVIIGNVTDKYRNVVIKTFMAHYWAVTRFSCKYVLKTDDDVYVRIQGLVKWLQMSGSPKAFYGGNIASVNRIIRNPNGKWFISMEQYNGTKWPPWCHGCYYVLSSDVIPEYLSYTYRRKPFHTDDAYIGVASKELGVKAVQIPGFSFGHQLLKEMLPDRKLNVSLAIGHRVNSEQMTKLHRYYTKYMFV